MPSNVQVKLINDLADIEYVLNFHIWLVINLFAIVVYLLLVLLVFLMTMSTVRKDIVMISAGDT